MNPIDRQKLTEWLVNRDEYIPYSNLRRLIQAGTFDASPTGAERVKEIDELLEIQNQKIAYHRENGDSNSEYFYRGYNAALRKERNWHTGVGTHKKECCDNPDPQTFGSNEHIQTPTTVCMGCGKLLKEETKDDPI